MTANCSEISRISLSNALSKLAAILGPSRCNWFTTMLSFRITSLSFFESTNAPTAPSTRGWSSDAGTATFPSDEPQHFLYFLPLSHGHGSLRPILCVMTMLGYACLMRDFQLYFRIYNLRVALGFLFPN